MIDTIVIQPNADYAVHVKGKVFAIFSATGDFDVELDNGGYQSGFPGLKEGPGDKFKRIRFRDTSGAQNSVKFYAGDADITPNVPTNAAGTAAQMSMVDAASAPVSGVYVIQANDTVEQIASGSSVYVTSIELVPGKAVSSGVVTPNTGGDVYIGRTSTQLPYKRATTDTDYPAVFTAPPGQKIALSSFRVRGNAGDGVAYTYTPSA